MNTSIPDRRFVLLVAFFLCTVTLGFGGTAPSFIDHLFIEVSPTERQTKDFLVRFDQFKSQLGSQGVEIEQIWTGKQLYLRVCLPQQSGVEQNSLIAEVEAHPLVVRTISASAAYQDIPHIDRLQKFGIGESVAESKLRGFREKRRNFTPDLAAEHTNELVVKYLDSTTTDPSLLASAQSRVKSLHSSIGAKINETLRLGDSLVDVVAIPKESDIEAALQVYLNSEDI